MLCLACSMHLMGVTVPFMSFGREGRFRQMRWFLGYHAGEVWRAYRLLDLVSAGRSVYGPAPLLVESAHEIGSV